MRILDVPMLINTWHFCVLHFSFSGFLICILCKMKFNMSSYMYWPFGYTLQWCTFLFILVIFVFRYLSLFVLLHTIDTSLLQALYILHIFSLWDLHTLNENFNDFQFVTLFLMHSEVLLCLRFIFFPSVFRGSGFCFPLKRCFLVSYLHLWHV